MSYNVFILAGSRRGKDDPVALAAGVDYKALAPVGGWAMIERVMGALDESGMAGRIVISAPEDMVLESDAARIASGASPVASVLEMLETLEDDSPILLTTADHALLSAQMVQDFIKKYDAARFDISVAMLPLQILTAKYPDMRRTRLRFRDGDFKSCNLFIFKNKAAARSILNFWRSIETQRKNPWKMIKALGVLPLLRYLAGQLNLQDALDILGRKTDTRIQAVMLDIPEAAIDVDSAEDLAFVRDIVEASKS